MNILIRADSSIQIGTGHVMRCLALADGLRRHGATVSFACRELPGNICSLIEASGYAVHRLLVPGGGNAQGAGNLDWRDDAQQTASSLAAGKAATDWLIVDHYALDRKWETMMRPYVGRIMAIDDLADRTHDCDLLLDQNLCENFEMRYEGLTRTHCRKLLGPRYALLRAEFEQERQKLRVRNGSVRRILIFFGGSDSTNETAKALEAIRLLNRPEIAVDVVVGGGNPHKDRVKVLCDALPNARFYCQVSNMAELMANADLAIGAGGGTTWERFCLELPSLVIAVASNQEPVAEKAASEGRLLYLGKSDEVTAGSISQAVGTLLQAHGWLNFLAKSGSDLVDGRGVERVVRGLMDREISLRRVELGDCGNVYAWRNADETRKHSFGSDPIFRGEHDQWFAATLANPDQVLLIGECQGDAVGVLRYDLQGEDATVSVYLVPGKHGHGYGPHLLRAGCNWLRENQPGMQSVVAEVFTANRSSVKAFLESGFEHYIAIFRKNLDE